MPRQSEESIPDSAEPPEPADTQSFAELVSDLAAEVTQLVRQELALATTELERKGRDAARNVFRLTIGVAIGAVSALVLVAASVLALGNVVPMWASALIIAALLAICAHTVFRIGSSSLRAMSFVPTETLSSLGEDRVWAKDQIDATRDQMAATMSEMRGRLAHATTKRKRPAARRKRSI